MIHSVGAGGGYNERDGVEYVDREDSDEEFDEVCSTKKNYTQKMCLPVYFIVLLFFIVWSKEKEVSWQATRTFVGRW